MLSLHSNEVEFPNAHEALKANLKYFFLPLYFTIVHFVSTVNGRLRTSIPYTYDSLFVHYPHLFFAHIFTCIDL